MTDVLTLDDLNGSSTTESTDTESTDNDDELAQLVDEVGGDIEGARAHIDANGNKEGYMEWLRAFARNFEQCAAVSEKYRWYNDQKRIDLSYLRNMPGEWTAWRQAFYGDSDNPDEGTYNHIQQKSRNTDGCNLIFYKSIFPEPQAEFWPGDEAVVWEERPNEDSHIYVTKEWAEKYADFAREINGRQRPLPPSNSEIEGSDSSDSTDSSLAFDPSDYTVRELADELKEGWSASALEEVLDAELAGENRKTAKKKIKRAISRAKEAEDSAEAGDDSDESDESEMSDYEQRMATAGRLKGEHDLDEPVAAIAGMLDAMDEEEVVEALA